jgi:hypothetical protein
MVKPRISRMTRIRKDFIRVIPEIRGPVLLIPNFEMRAAWQQNDG